LLRDTQIEDADKLDAEALIQGFDDIRCSAAHQNIAAGDTNWRYTAPRHAARNERIAMGGPQPRLRPPPDVDATMAIRRLP